MPNRQIFSRLLGINPLLAYDFLLLSRGFAATFRTWRDTVLLLIGSMVTILWLRERVGESSALSEPGVVALLGALFAVAFNRKISKRLAFHAAESILTPEGLDLLTRRHYVIAWCALSALALVALGLAIDPKMLLPLMSGYLGALVFGQIAARVVRPRDMLRRLKRRYAGGIIELPVPGPLGYGSRATRSVAIVAAAAAANAFVVWVAARQASELAEMIVLVLMTLACLALLTRLDHATVRFLALAGHGPWRSLGVLMAPTALYCAILLLLTILLLGQREALAVGILGAGAALLMASKILIYRIHEKTRADTLLAVGLAGLTVIGTAVPPVLLLAVPALGLLLLRRSASMTWSMP